MAKFLHSDDILTGDEYDSKMDETDSSATENKTSIAIKPKSNRTGAKRTLHTNLEQPILDWQFSHFDDEHNAVEKVCDVTFYVARDNISK